jgi:hypothetical protein
VTFYDAYTANVDWWNQATTLRPHLVSPLIPMSYIESTDINSLNLVKNSNYLQGDSFFGGTQANPTNPYADAFAAGDSKFVSRQFQFNTEFDVDLGVLTKGLMFRARYGIDYASTYNQGYSNKYATFAPSWTNYAGADMIGSITQYGRDEKTGNENISNSTYRYTYNISGQFDYTNTFAEHHNVFAMLVANAWQTQRNSHYHRTTNANLGLQLSYNYDHTYYVDFSAAMPYSTKLPEGNRTVSLIDNFLSSIPADAEENENEKTEEKGHRRKPTAADATIDYMAYLLATDFEEETSEEETKEPEMKGQNLIDTFIEGDGFNLQDKPEYKPEVSTEPEDSEKLPEEEYLTETLAGIYIKQGKYLKALEIIKRLNLNIPKKNAYFADQIRFLEKLIVNSGQKIEK